MSEVVYLPKVEWGIQPILPGTCTKAGQIYFATKALKPLEVKICSEQVQKEIH